MAYVKSPGAFRTISEVSELLGVPAHVLRFWETKFSQVRPVKRGGGRRYYRPEDVALLTGIRDLLYDDGLTIKGVQKVLRERGQRHVAALAEGETPAPVAPAPAGKAAAPKPAPGPAAASEAPPAPKAPARAPARDEAALQSAIETLESLRLRMETDPSEGMEIVAEDGDPAARPGGAAPGKRRALGAG